MHTIDPNATVGDLVVERPARSRVFQRLGIDFCCGGKKPLADACRDKGLSVAEVAEALSAEDAGDRADDLVVSGLTLCELCDHIERTHHAYLRAELPRVYAMVRKVAAVHGEKHPWTVELAGVFASFAEELDTHMFKEDRVLFPWIRGLERGGEVTKGHCGGSINNPIRMMEHEHDDAGRALERMRELSHGFTPPPGACNTFVAMLDGLARIEADMHRHVHKENNVLFPRAADLERGAASSAGDVAACDGGRGCHGQSA
jgi:regulator of cell morphogenesis and NO signaling